jgi:hypothetical protein
MNRLSGRKAARDQGRIFGEWMSLTVFNEGEGTPSWATL